MVEEGKLTTCELPEDDPPFPKPRHWTDWSNDNNDYSAGMGLDFPVQECPEGEFIESMAWKAWSGYGLVDFKMKCSGSSSWTEPAVGDYDHHGIIFTFFKILDYNFSR